MCLIKYILKVSGTVTCKVKGKGYVLEKDKINLNKKDSDYYRKLFEIDLESNDSYKIYDTAGI